jgi:hypothetical protein
LLLTIVTDCGASGAQARRQGSFSDDASIPDRADEIIFADDVVPVPDQIVEEIEDLRRDGYRARPNSSRRSVSNAYSSKK